MRNKINLIAVAFASLLVFAACPVSAEKSQVQKNTAKVNAAQVRVNQQTRQMMASHLKRQQKNLVKGEALLSRIRERIRQLEGDKAGLEEKLAEAERLAEDARKLLASGNDTFGGIKSGEMPKTELTTFISDMKALQGKLKELKQSLTETVMELRKAEEGAVKAKPEGPMIKKDQATTKDDINPAGREGTK